MGIKSSKKLIVILGPTASGKSDLAVKLALFIKKNHAIFGLRGAEVVSADSRQVYLKMDIGTGKITEKEMRDVPHHLLDVASPKRKFSVAQYQKLANDVIEKINKRNGVAILCGGSAFYIKAVAEGVVFPEVSPNWSFRKKLEKERTEELYKKLAKKDPKRAEHIDEKNRRRLIRALEIIEETKKPVSLIQTKPSFDCLFLGVKTRQEVLDKKIKERLEKRLKQKMIEEVEELKKCGLSWKRLEGFGLEYKWISLYLQKKVCYEEMKERLLNDIKRFSKKQMVWWKHDKRINWIKTKKEAEKLITLFLKK